MLQVIVIHGADTFDTYEQYLEFLKNAEITLDYLKQKQQKRWKEELANALGAGFDVIRPEMPNKFNAKYSEWKIWFEKIIPYLESKVILVGHSLGGAFLAKYLAENRISKKILGLLLVAAPYQDSTDPVAGYSLADFKLPTDLSSINKQCEKIFIYQSEDDFVVPFSDLALYQTALPLAAIRIFKNRGHFLQESFPELVTDIRSLH